MALTTETIWRSAGVLIVLIVAWRVRTEDWGRRPDYPLDAESRAQARRLAEAGRELQRRRLDEEQRREADR